MRMCFFRQSKSFKRTGTKGVITEKVDKGQISMSAKELYTLHSTSVSHIQVA